MEKEAEKFLEEFEKPVEENPFDFVEGPTPAPEKEVVAEPENTSEVEPRNRRERRLMQKLQSEKESSIALAARLEALSEAKKARSEESEFLAIAERIYGSQTPELREATELLKTALLGVKDEAKREAIQEFEAIRQKEDEAVKNAEKRLDAMVEQIEDEIDTELTQSQRTEFFKLLKKMSPKDAQGNIIEYADHFAVWDIFQEKQKKPQNPAKAISARAMTQGSDVSSAKITQDANERWLRENGII